MDFLVPGLADIIDILLVSVILYEVFVITKRTGGYQILSGLIFVFVLYFIAVFFHLELISALLQSLRNVWVLALVILFQPELRNVLARFGQSRDFSSVFKRSERNHYGEVIEAVSAMSFRKTGALIIIENKRKLDEFINAGERMDAIISTRLIMTIFNTKTVLHDGAVILRKDRLMAAKVVLPLSANPTYSQKYGTRHLAALGISEVSDAFAIVVSEQTGRVSIAQNGELITDVPFEELMQRISDATSD